MKAAPTLDALDTNDRHLVVLYVTSSTALDPLLESAKAGTLTHALAPVASALTDGGSVSSGVDYHRLLDPFDWYNLQFYGWGSLPSGSSSSPPNYTPNYEAVVAATGSANVSKLVAGVLTNPDDGNGYVSLSELTPVLSALASRYADFGGVMGWNYGNALGPAGTVDPAGWAAAMAASLQAS